jgi:hypothetical protein
MASLAGGVLASGIDQALHEETRNAARALITQVKQRREGSKAPDEGLREPRPK